MNNDFSELIQYLDEKFIDVKKDIGELKVGFNNLTNSVDAYAKKSDAYFQEMKNGFWKLPKNSALS